MQGLRRFSYRYPVRKQVLKDARVARGKYVCVQCGPSILHGPRDIQVDHVVPVIDPATGFVDWNTYIDRLFPKAEHLQVLCKAHHKEKTAEENSRRRMKIYREYKD